MRALDHIEIKNFISVGNSNVDRFARGFPKLMQNRVARFPQNRLMIARRGQPHQLGSDEVGSGIPPEEITFTFHVSEDAVRSGLVDARLPRNFSQVEPCRRSMESFQNPQNSGHYAYRSGFGLTRSDHRHILIREMVVSTQNNATKGSTAADFRVARENAKDVDFPNFANNRKCDVRGESRVSCYLPVLFMRLR